MAVSVIENMSPIKRTQTYGHLVIQGGDFQKKLSNYIKSFLLPYSNGTFVVGWYAGSPTNLPSNLPQSAGVFIAVFPKGLSNGIRVVEVTGLTFGTVDYSPD